MKAIAIQFKPEQYDPNEVYVHVWSGLKFQYGEVKYVPIDKQIRIKRVDAPNGFVYVNLVENLLRNRNFVLAKTGRNPNAVCTKCGKTSYDASTFHPKTGRHVPLVIDGKKVCLECFEAAPKLIHPDSIEIIQE